MRQPLCDGTEIITRSWSPEHIFSGFQSLIFLKRICALAVTILDQNSSDLEKILSCNSLDKYVGQNNPKIFRVFPYLFWRKISHVSLSTGTFEETSFPVVILKLLIQLLWKCECIFQMVIVGVCCPHTFRLFVSVITFWNKFALIRLFA